MAPAVSDGHEHFPLYTLDSFLAPVAHSILSVLVFIQPLLFWLQNTRLGRKGKYHSRKRVGEALPPLVIFREYVGMVQMSPL